MSLKIERLYRHPLNRPPKKKKEDIRRESNWGVIVRRSSSKKRIREGKMRNPVLKVEKKWEGRGTRESPIRGEVKTF